VTEAGGSVSDFSGGADWLYGKEIICTNTLVEKEFLEVIKKYFQKG
jgi:myo-inositol-1(or 4)-monophosphatase